jgi:hypothetical protein
MYTFERDGLMRAAKMDMFDDLFVEEIWPYDIPAEERPLDVVRRVEQDAIAFKNAGPDKFWDEVVIPSTIKDKLREPAVRPDGIKGAVFAEVKGKNWDLIAFLVIKGMQSVYHLSKDTELDKKQFQLEHALGKPGEIEERVLEMCRKYGVNGPQKMLDYIDQHMQQHAH